MAGEIREDVSRWSPTNKEVAEMYARILGKKTRDERTSKSQPSLFPSRIAPVFSRFDEHDVATRFSALRPGRLNQ